ncbi:MAG: hypothetical protein IJZ42_10810 [Lachnospiraceae bacterium]|nr:hypothetical protein [Lachnospiraceae bacterium]
MKKCFLTVICAFVMLLALSGCKSTGTATTGNERVNQIISLDIISAVENEQNIYRLKYPDYYYTADKDNLAVSSNKMLYCIDNKTMTEADFTYIVDYVNSISELDGVDGDHIAYRVVLNYYDENGESCQIRAIGRDALPEGWNEFVDHINYVCGEEYLTAEGNILEITPEFLTSIYGVTDEDVREGTLADVIAQNNITVVGITNFDFHMDWEIEKFYRDKMEPVIAPFRPTDIEIADSSAQEYEQFISDYLATLGEDWKEYPCDQNHLRYFYNEVTRDGFYLGRSADLNNMDIETPTDEGEYCMIHLDAHMEDMTIRTDYIYSADKKYILVNCADIDLILTFIGMNS